METEWEPATAIRANRVTPRRPIDLVEPIPRTKPREGITIRLVSRDSDEHFTQVKPRMQIVHHPDVSTIMTCSAGSQPEALCAVVTSHLSMCPVCMRELSLLEEIGVGLFECSRGDEQGADGSVPTVADMITEIRQVPGGAAKGDVPWPLIPLLGDYLDAIQWTEIEPGISTSAIELTAHAKGDLRLLRLDAGKRLPEHGHVGEELTLVLRGSYSDESGEFGVGDVSDLDDETRHSMLAGDDGCIVLIASETEPEFLSKLARSEA